jgi:Family of unknown function (DUF6411)
VLVASVVLICILLFALALVAPRLSRGPERATHRAFGAGSRGASKTPGKLGTWLAKPFNKSSRAAGKSAAEGREARAKLPL